MSKTPAVPVQGSPREVGEPCPHPGCEAVLDVHRGATRIYFACQDKSNREHRKHIFYASDEEIEKMSSKA